MSQVETELTIKDGSQETGRVARKRQKTRARIVVEAERLFFERSVDEVTISDITAAADVGHGTFYLHFKSKYEVLVPIVQSRGEVWDAQIQMVVDGLDDPAEIMSITSRHMGRLIHGDPLWRWFLEHSGVPVDAMQDAIGRFSGRDFGRGLVSGRFQVPELGISSAFLLGGFVNSLLVSFSSDDPGLMIDQTTEMMMRVLGLPAAEAITLAHAPLPELSGTM